VTSSRFILSVDPDRFLQEMIESGFRLFQPDWTLLKADDPETGLFMLRRYEVDAVVTEIELSGTGDGGVGQTGAEFLGELERSHPDVPVFILTEAPAEEVQGLTTADFIAKPPDMDYLIGKVHRAVQRRRESVVRGISLESFLQMLEVERKSCTLTVTSGPRSGRLYVRGGALIHAEAGNRAGKTAAFAILSWTDYRFEILDECHAEPTITDGLSSILMEWCVQKDHGLL